MMARAKSDPVAELYAAEPEGFIAARDALAAELRAAGEEDRAAEVKRLRKPTVAAWGVDAAARSEQKLVEALIASGERLAGAQRQAMSGKRGTDDLRTATEERRTLIRQLTDAAVGALTDAGRPGESNRDEIAGTFEAATLDPAVAERIKAGVLDRIVQPASGLGSLEGFTVLEGGAAAARPKKTPAAERREAERFVRDAEKAQAVADAAADRARDARTAGADAARHAEELAAGVRHAGAVVKRDAAEA
jgi:hypothetical protein